MNDSPHSLYFPAIICAEFDSPIDALRSLHVPADEAMNLVVASWLTGETTCLLTALDGGRNVAALRTAPGRWAACNAFPEQASTACADAQRRLEKLTKRGKRGMIGRIDRRAPAISVGCAG